MISDGHKPSPTSVLRDRTFLMEIVRGTAEERPFDFLSIHKISNRPDNNALQLQRTMKIFNELPPALSDSVDDGRAALGK